MDPKAFSSACKRDGYDDVEQRQGTPGFTAKPHTHPFSVRGLVLDGEFRLTRNGETQVCRAGDSFSMESGCEHAESFGADGATYLVARKHDAADARGKSE